jgi:GxxExxY protein
MGGTSGKLKHADITDAILGAFFEVYRELGYGYVESVYVAGLVNELVRRGLSVRREVLVRVWYKGEEIAWQRIDLIVNDVIVIECKAGPLLAPHARLQLYNYLRGTSLEVGLLLHFGPKAFFERAFSENR